MHVGTLIRIVGGRFRSLERDAFDALLLRADTDADVRKLQHSNLLCIFPGRFPTWCNFCASPCTILVQQPMPSS